MRIFFNNSQCDLSCELNTYSRNQVVSFFENYFAEDVDKFCE